MVYSLHSRSFTSLENLSVQSNVGKAEKKSIGRNGSRTEETGTTRPAIVGNIAEDIELTPKTILRRHSIHSIVREKNVSFDLDRNEMFSDDDNSTAGSFDYRASISDHSITSAEEAKTNNDLPESPQLNSEYTTDVGVTLEKSAQISTMQQKNRSELKIDSTESPQFNNGNNIDAVEIREDPSQAGASKQENRSEFKTDSSESPRFNNKSTNDVGQNREDSTLAACEQSDATLGEEAESISWCTLCLSEDSDNSETSTDTEDIEDKIQKKKLKKKNEPKKSPKHTIAT